MTLPYKFRRACVVVIPLFNIVAFLGILNGIAKLDEGLFSSSITLGMILAALNMFLLFLTAKHLAP